MEVFYFLILYFKLKVIRGTRSTHPLSHPAVNKTVSVTSVRHLNETKYQQHNIGAYVLTTITIKCKYKLIQVNI